MLTLGAGNNEAPIPEELKENSVSKMIVFGAAAFAFALASLATIASADDDDLVYVAVEPCRIADTRKSNSGTLDANETRNFLISGDESELAPQGGDTDCEHPKDDSDAEPVAVAAYIIAVSAPSSSGNGALSVYPSNLPPPPAGSGTTVNYTEASNIGNTTIVAVCSDDCPPGGELAILNRNSDRDVVIDIQGYFYSATDNGLCEVSDIEGSWQTFIAESALGASSCNVEVSDSGAVTGGACATTEGGANVTGGQLQVNAVCEVQGTLFVDGEQNLLETARLSIDRNLITGIVSIDGLVTHFTAARR